LAKASKWPEAAFVNGFKRSRVCKNAYGLAVTVTHQFED
jgi:K+ transporter